MEQETTNNQTGFQPKYIVILLVIAILLVGAFYLLSKSMNEDEQKPAANATMEEKVLYTLKNRYGKDFVKASSTTYKDSNGVVFAVETNEINGEKFIVFDDYLNELQTNKIATKISNILVNHGLTGVSIKLAPAKDCRFVGSCVSNDNYYANYKDNTDETLLAKRSEEINLKDYISMSNSEYFNELEFYLYIKLIGNYDSSNKENVKNALIDLFNQLNESGYKNNLGYEVEVKKNDGITDVMKLKAKTNSSKTFSLNDAKES